MIKSITVELEERVRANVLGIVDENEKLRAENLTLRNANQKMADKLTLLKNAETMHSRLFQEWLDDRVTIIIK